MIQKIRCKKTLPNTKEDERKITQTLKPYSSCFVSQKGKNSTLLFVKNNSDFLTPVGPLGVPPYRFEKNSV
jgi:hypothetical protein